VFGKVESESIKGYDSTIESKVNIDGNIYTESSLYIAAKLNGEIRSDSDIYVGVAGIINGNVFARNICIAGVVEGAVEASGVLKVLNTGKVYGDINVFRFIMSEGAVFEGKCSMSDLNTIKPSAPDIRKLRSGSGMFRKKDYLEDMASALQIEESAAEKN